MRISAARGAAGCGTAYVGLAVAVGTGWTGGVDRLGRPLTSWSTGTGLVPPLHVVEVVFDHTGVLAILLAVVIASLVLRAAAVGILVALSVVTTTVLTTVVKLLVGRDRPPWQVPEHLLGGGSFPSGHTSSVTAVLGALCVGVLWLARERGWPDAVRWWTVAGTGSVVALVGADRVLLGRHYPSDVLGGLLLGATVVLASVAVLSASVADSPSLVDQRG